MLNWGGGAGSWRPGLRGSKQTAKAPPPARRRDGFVPSMSSGKLSDQGGISPPVSCWLPQFAEGKAAWPCWVLSPRGTFLRLNTDPNQSSGQANPSLLHPSHTEQPLEKVCLTYSALPQCALRHALLPYELQRRASTMRERRHGALHPYGERVPRGRSHPSCHAAEKQLPRHKVVCEEKGGKQVLAQG